MNKNAIKALVSKDLTLFFRNRFYGMITVFGIVMYIAIYLLMPSTVDEEFDLALHAPQLPPAFELLQEEGFNVETFSTEELLVEAVDEGDYAAGISLPPDVMEKLASGQRPEITVFYPSGSPPEIEDAITTFIQELAFMQTGQPLSFTLNAEILGPDMLGDQIPTRDRMIPLFALALILFETIGLASLITEEIEYGTARAILTTPMTTKDLFASKAIMGILLAFGQGLLLMAILGGLSSQPLIIITALLLGAIMVTALGFLIAAISKNMMSVMGWGMIAMISLLLPTFAVMFPGSISGWVQAIPSYYLSDTIHRAANFNMGWGDLWQNLAILVGINAALVLLGITALRRRFNES